MPRNYVKRPLILAHRGASALAPENTLAAFLRARDLGADGVELDVTLTRDSVPVVIHDDTVDRTTDGHGAVSNKTLLEIKRLDAGGWKSPTYHGETIPTLAEVFDALADWLRPAGLEHKGVVNVEMKSETLRTDGVERKVVKIVEQKNLQESVIISSFNPLALARVRALNCGLMRGLLYDLSLPFYLRRAWLRLLAAPHALHPDHAMVDSGYMLWATRHAYTVNTWTVDEPQEALRLTGLGVNALITNKPDLIGRSLANHAARNGG
jgi:glycerophosphoryl diester phosphodiesterase